MGRDALRLWRPATSLGTALSNAEGRQIEVRMRAYRVVLLFAASLIAGSVTFAQVGRGWSDWPTPYADAQRTSWLPADPNISVESISKPGFELQWTSKLDNQRRGLHGLTQGVTASGVTLFVPASIVAGSSNKLYMLDNDTGYVIWSRTFEGTPPAPTVACSGGVTAAPTRIVSGAAPSAPTADAAPAPAGRGNQQGYRSSLGEPGQGIPVEPRGGGPGRGAPAAPARQGGAPGPGAPVRGQGAGIPGAPNVGGRGLGQIMVGYAVAADGQLHVVGLQSGKDLQKPAAFLPPNSQFSNPVAVGTMMYSATAGNCAGAPNGVYAIDLDSPDKTVVSYRTNGGSVVGAVAFSSDGNTLLAAIGSGSVTGNGKANAIVALDPRTLQLKDWFTQPTAEFVTGPTVFRHGTKDLVSAATKDGRVMLLDTASLGGADHATPLVASPPLFASGGSISAEALSTWTRASLDFARDSPEQRRRAAPATTATADSATRRWILVPVSGRPVVARTTNGAIRNGAVVALQVRDVNGTFSLEPEWTSNDLTSPATPIIVNGVVFALSTGRPAEAGRTGSPAVLFAHDGLSGKAIWNSGKSMTASASPGSFWSALSQVYVGAGDGTVYAFGFLDERR
jgi:outer membrane protein assembly factor BamB